MSNIILLSALIAISIALSLIMAGAWLLQQRTSNSRWIDTIWAFGLGAVGLVGAVAPLSAATWPTFRQIIVSVLVMTWSLRLSVHIMYRSANVMEDPRYTTLRQQWGSNAHRKMFWLLQKQAWVAIPLATAILLAGQNPVSELRLQDTVGIIVLLIAILGETLADRQLHRFCSDPYHKRKICDVGLWHWSRHPNYFFEWLGWLAYPMFAISVTGDYPWGYLALLAPACMYWLLVHISGIPPLEAHLIETRGDAYRAYQARTRAFVPLSRWRI